MLDLPKILADVQSPTLEGEVVSGIVHFLVPVNEVDLYKLDYLHSYIERDGDNDLEREEEKKEKEGGKGGKE